jgi:hypothetical protein
VADCLGSDGTMTVFQFAEPQHRDGRLNDLPSRCRIPYSMISSFVVAPRGFCSKAYSKGL